MNDIKRSIQKIQDEIQRLIRELDQVMAAMNEEEVTLSEDKGE